MMTPRPGVQRVARTAVTATAVLLILAFGAITVVSQHGVYKATARIALVASPAEGQPNIEYDPGVPAMFSIAIESYSVLVYSETFLRRVIDRQHLDMTSAELRDAIRVTSPHGTTLVDFEVGSDDPAEARRAATAAADEFALVVPELERPTPITAHVLDAEPARPAFPDSVVRTCVLSAIAAVTAVGVAAFLWRRPIGSPSPVHTGSESSGGRP